MTLNELRIKCIRKTEQGDDETLTAANFDSLKEDSEYQAFALNVDDAINEATRYLIVNDKIPLKSLEVEVASALSVVSKSSYEALSSAREIRKCHFIESSGTAYAVEFTAFDGKIFLSSPVKDGTLYIFYQPVLEEVSSSVDGDTDISELGFDDSVVLFVLNYAKAELYERQEPDIAMAYRNIALQYAAAFRSDVSLPTQRKVRRIVRL